MYVYYSIVMECMFVSPENSYAEALTAPRDGISEVTAPRGGGPTEARASSGLEHPSCSPASLRPDVTPPRGNGHLQAGKHTLITHCPCPCLHPGLPASRAVGTEYLLLNPQPAVICYKSLSRCRRPPSLMGAHRHAGEQDPTLLTPPPAQGKMRVVTPADF